MLNKPSHTLATIADYIGAELRGDATVLIRGIAPFNEAGSEQLTFVADAAMIKQLPDIHAAAVILNVDSAAVCKTNALIVSNPRLAFAKAAELFDYKKLLPKKRIHKTAVIAKTSKIAKTASIGSQVTIGDYCEIGDNTIIKANVSIADDVKIGKNCIIHQGAVIGSDGFGNANVAGTWYKIPQLGGVIIGDNVEIGANSTVDCGTLGNTIIEDGVKIDNLVQIAHNVHIGAHTAIAAQTGIAGSTKIGKYCMFGGQVGVNGHIEICDQVIFTGQAMVTHSIKKPGVYSSGTGLMENNLWKKVAVRIKNLDLFSRLVLKLEKLFLSGACKDHE